MGEKDWVRQDAAQAQRVTDECARHGVGLILVDDPAGKAEPIHHRTAVRKTIDHEKCSSFLGAVLTQKGRERVAAWK